MTGAVDKIVQVKRLQTIDEFRDRLALLGIADQLGVDDTVEPTGPLATPFEFTDGSVGTRTVGNRFAVLPIGLKEARYIGAFRTPTLRNLLRTAPYFHDGSAESLEFVKFAFKASTRIVSKLFDERREGNP